MARLKNMIESVKNHGLSYSALLPLEWIAINAKPDVDELAHYSETNEGLFKTLVSFDEYHPDLNDNSDPIHLQLQRMDDKLNTIVQLLGRAISSSLSIPAKKKTVLTTQFVKWVDKHSPLLNSYILIKLYIKPGFPQPLELVGCVSAVEKEEDDFAITANLFEQNEFVIDGLEKLIFRHHRRVVALSKKV